MHISGQENINKDGCSYRISIAQSVIEVSLRWEDGFYSYNEEEVIQTINDDNRITDQLKLSIYQCIDHMNQLFYSSHAILSEGLASETGGR